MILAELATCSAVLVVVAPIALRLFAFVVMTNFVAVFALTVLAAKGGARATAFALNTFFVAWLTL